MAIASISKTLTKYHTLRAGGSYSSLSRQRGPRLFSSSYSNSAAALSSVPLPSSSFSSQHQENRRGRSTWSKWLLFLPGAITFGLGTWQIFRRQDKIKVLEYRQKRLEMEPLKFNIMFPSTENLDSLEFRRVVCRGFFDEERSIYVGPRSRSISGVTENGYYVITPLVPIPNNPESHRSWSTEDGSLAVGGTSLLEFHEIVNILQIEHPLSKKVNKALGGGFGQRSLG